MNQELNTYIYILEEKKGSSHHIISFETTLGAAQKMLNKLVNRAKETLEVGGAQVYTTKSLNKNSITLFRTGASYLVQETRISIKRVPNHPPDSL